MPPPLALALVPTEPGGPARGDALLIDGAQLTVLRRGLMGRRREAVRPRADVVRVAGGPAPEVASLGWLSPGAQIAAQSRASSDWDEAGGDHLLAVALAGPVTEATWLFRGSPAAVSAATRALGGAPVAPGTAPAPTLPAAGAGPGAAARRGHGLPVLRLALTLAALGAVALVALSTVGRVADTVGDVRSALTAALDVPPPAVAGGFAPYAPSDLVGVWNRGDAIGPGLRRDLSDPPHPVGGRWGAGLLWRGRPVRLELHPTPAAARRAGRGAVLRGNLVVRGPALPPRVRAALWRALAGAAPRVGR